jgi:hypothetical protein
MLKCRYRLRGPDVINIKVVLKETAWEDGDWFHLRRSATVTCSCESKIINFFLFLKTLRIAWSSELILINIFAPLNKFGFFVLSPFDG